MAVPSAGEMDNAHSADDCPGAKFGLLRSNGRPVPIGIVGPESARRSMRPNAALVGILASLVFALVLAACDGDEPVATGPSPAAPLPAPTATPSPSPAPSPTPSPAPSPTPTPSPEPPRGTPLAIEIDETTLWGEVFDGFSADEQACVRTRLPEPAIEAGLAAAVMSDSETSPFEIAVFACMDPEAASELFLATFIAGTDREHPDGFAPSADEIACLREWSAQADVAQLVADTAGDDPGDSLAALGGMLNCVPEAFLPVLLDGMDIDTGDLSAEQLECLRELARDLDWVALFGSAADEDAGALLVLGLQFLACLPDLLDGAFDDEVGAAETPDDHADEVAEATLVSLDDVTVGSIDYVEDIDFFTFAAREGSIYQIDVSPDADLDPVATLYGPHEASLNNLQPEFLFSNDDFGGSLGSRIVWRARGSAPHHVEVGAFGPGGSYAILVSELDVVDEHGDDSNTATAITAGRPIAGSIDYPGDVDMFRIDAASDAIYEFTVELGSLADSAIAVFSDDSGLSYYNDDFGFTGGSKVFVPIAASESHFIEVSADTGTGTYTLTARVSDISDDHGDWTDAATRVALGSPAEGSIDYPGDSDVFAFAAQAGALYQIEAEIRTLESVQLGISDADDWYIADAVPTGLQTVGVVLRAAATGDYYLRLETYSGLGAYRVTVRLSDVVDDHGDDSDGATPLRLGTAAPGSIDYFGDVDVFTFTAAGGVLYEAELESDSVSGARVEIYDSSGTWLASQENYGDSEPARAFWRGGAAAPYYLEVSYPGGDGGDYLLTVAESAITDDHGNRAETATPVTVGQLVAGNLEYDSDQDVFAFAAAQGDLYQIDVSLGTLGDSRLALHDGEGRTLESNDDYGDSLASRIYWEAPESGTYLVHVDGFGSGLGTYSLQIVER